MQISVGMLCISGVISVMKVVVMEKFRFRCLRLGMLWLSRMLVRVNRFQVIQKVRLMLRVYQWLKLCWLCWLVRVKNLLVSRKFRLICQCFGRGDRIGCKFMLQSRCCEVRRRVVKMIEKNLVLFLSMLIVINWVVLVKMMVDRFWFLVGVRLVLMVIDFVSSFQGVMVRDNGRMVMVLCRKVWWGRLWVVMGVWWW